MRKDTILRRIERSLELIESGKTEQVYRPLLQTAKEIKEAMGRKKEKEPKVRELIGWYLSLWDNEPPEILKYTEPMKVIGKHFKELVKIYRNNNLDVDDLKYEYQSFKEADTKLIGWKKKLLGDRGIVQFRYVLPRWKGIPEQARKKWTTSENERGLDYYLNQNDITF